MLALPLLGVRAASAQTLDDAEMLQRRELHATVMYGSDSWSEYWEGTLRRSNGNVGTVTTRSVTVHAGVGLTERLTVIGALPYVWTEASQGVLHGMSGRQDFTLLAKYRVANPRIAGRARLKVLAVGGVSTPTSDYTPDFLPMSIGLHSESAITRLAAHLQDRTGWFVDGYAERVWRSNVTLDRTAYFSDGQYYETNEVAMPDVAKYRGTLGWQRGAWCIPVGLTAQRTLGGGDIRRQDMPFVSNRMDATMAHAELMYFLPGVSNLRLDLGAAHTLRGRNVGRSTSLMTGVTYALHL
ncbi:MAG: hypothetical protein ACJ79A_01750 [Gemmatimonadaceae bacterium]